MGNSCCTRLCMSTCISTFCMFLTMVATVFEAAVGTMNLAHCPMQPQLPALLSSAGFSGGLFLLCMLILSWVTCACCAGMPKTDSTLRRAIKWCLIGLAISAVSTTIVLNIFLVHIYQRDFTVVVVDQRDDQDCQRRLCPAIGTVRGPNPKVSTDEKHPSYCRRDFLHAVGIISSPFYVLALAAGMLLPLIFCVLHLCGRPCEPCPGRGFKELKSELDCENVAGITPVKDEECS